MPHKRRGCLGTRHFFLRRGGGESVRRERLNMKKTAKYGVAEYKASVEKYAQRANQRKIIQVDVQGETVYVQPKSGLLEAVQFRDLNTSDKLMTFIEGSRGRLSERQLSAIYNFFHDGLQVGLSEFPLRFQ